MSSYEITDKSELKDNLDDVLLELRNDFYKSVVSIEAYDDFKDRCVWILNNYLCWIKGNERGYVLYRETIEEDIPNLNGEIVHCPIHLFLAKTDVNLKKDVGNYVIPDDVYIDEKTGELKFSNKYEPIIDIWLRSTERRKRREETFIREGRDCFPVFEHIAITRELAEKHAGDFSKIQPYLDFIKQHLCGNNEPLFEYFMNTLAFYLQFPAVKTGVVLVMKGLEGIGKGIFVQDMADIIGNCFFLQPSGVDEVFGNFNSLLDNKLLVFLDELVWGGDKQKTGVIKKLITEKRRTSNTKYGVQRGVENNFNGIIASNEEWVIPAGQNARRFVMTEVDDWLTYQSDEVIDALRNVDKFTYAHYLYSRDLSEFKPRKIVLTRALMEQKHLSLDPFMKYVIGLIAEEFLIEDEVEEKNEFGGSKMVKKRKQMTGILKTKLYEDYKNHTSHPIDFNPFMRKWNKLFPNTLNYDKGSKHKIWITFPPIKECKEIIKREFRQDMFLDEDDEEEEQEISVTSTSEKC